jgi:hypothetical protein
VGKKMAKRETTAMAEDPLDDVEIEIPTRTRAGGGADVSGLVARLLSKYDDTADGRKDIGTEWNTMRLERFCAAVGPQEFQDTMNVNSWKGSLQVKFNRTNVDGRTVILKMAGPRIEDHFRPTKDSKIRYKAVGFAERQASLGQRHRNSSQGPPDNGSDDSDS